jgi:16S rRNA (guanine527-N7)-methyltransferase
VTLTEARIAALLEPYLSGAAAPQDLYTRLSVYLDLLLRWNARTNLTAIRDPEEIVKRHFGESLFTGTQLASLLPPAATLLDFGSGAGFPGFPIQLLLPEIRVTLTESQGKKASFLREATRTLGLTTEVWAARVETLPSERRFNVVTLRAVDKMDLALTEAEIRILSGGQLVALGGRNLLPAALQTKSIPIPNSADTFLYISQR